MKVVTAEQMQEIDRTTIQERGVDGYDLMTRAGLAVAEAASEFIQLPGPILVLCGKGNNGGDGYITARYLADWGFSVALIPVSGTDELTGDAKRAFDDMPKGRVRILELPAEHDFPNLLDEMDGVIDAMLGTGAKPPLRPPYDWIVKAVNAAKLPVVSIDVPTGLHADTGEGDTIIRAALTVTMGLPKLGMLTPNGVQYCGRVRVEELKFASDLLTNEKITTETVTAPEVAQMLPPRPSDSHKGTFGLVTIAAGSISMPGAAVIAGIGALRSGVGLVRLHVPAPIKVIISSQLPEAILTRRAESQDTAPVLGPPSQTEWVEMTKRAGAIVVGPGMTTEDAPRALLLHILANFGGPVLVDADALNLLAESEELRKYIKPTQIGRAHV